MKEQLTSVRYSYLVLFCIALVVAVVGRIGLFVMDITGVLTYDYIAASTGTLLNQICTVLTGPSFFAFLFVAGLVLSLSTVGVALYGCWYEKGVLALAKPGYALVGGAAITVAALVCMFVATSGIMSAVQISSMKTKLTMDGGVMLMALLFLVAIITLLAAASLVVCACVSCAKNRRRIGVNLIIAAAVCGLVVMALTVGTFASVNVVELDGIAGAWWFGIDTVVNVAMMMVSVMLIKKAQRSKDAPTA